MQPFLTTEDVTDLHMVVMLCVSSLKPMFGANVVVAVVAVVVFVHAVDEYF